MNANPRFRMGRVPVIPKQGKGKSEYNSVPSFLIKTYDIVSDPDTDDIISWTLEGNSFVILKTNEF